MPNLEDGCERPLTPGRTKTIPSCDCWIVSLSLNCLETPPLHAGHREPTKTSSIRLLDGLRLSNGQGLRMATAEVHLKTTAQAQLSQANQTSAMSIFDFRFWVHVDDHCSILFMCPSIRRYVSGFTSNSRPSDR